jgi:ATP-dependent DNA helicase RecG
MSSPLQKLKKFLSLEIERGYDNRAVVGGLNKIIPSWQTEANTANLSSDLIQTICTFLEDYQSLEHDTRASEIQKLIDRIDTEILTLPVSVPNRLTSAQSDPDQRPTHTPKRAPVPPLTRDDTPSTVSNQHNQSEMEINPPSSSTPVGLSADLTVLPGVGQKTAQILQNLNLRTLEDLLFHFPRRYDDYSTMKRIIDLKYGDELSVIGTVKSAHNRPIKGGKLTMMEAVISDETGALRITWFNQPWLEKNIHPGAQIVVSGKVDIYLGRLCMTNPDWELLEQEHLHTNRIVPVYPLTANVTQKTLRRMMHQTVSFWSPRIADFLPESIRREGNLLTFQDALQQIHFPDNLDRLKAAQERLAFDEIFFIQLGVLRQKRFWQQVTSDKLEISEEWLKAQIERLPFALTNAQLRVLEDIRIDLQAGRPMNRLLQGDVGSGKTVIAALAIAMVNQHQAQSALMAPTSILAEQHYRNFIHLMTSTPMDEEAPFNQESIRLLIGDTPENEKRVIRQGLQNGSIKLVIGTHALLEDPIEFQNLQLAIIDEQHRFGVEQRAILRSKGTNPHVLVMTATPIPRSLALTIYGDLDVSTIDEMPPGRQPISTYIFPPVERERAYSFIRSQIQAGHQAFIIYPLVDNEEKEDMAAVQAQSNLQQEVFPEYTVGLMHGRLRPAEKDQIMTDFRDGKYHILASTSVIEVGIDIPNATAILIEGANRFGLSQLHQFRGRVGRGEAPSYCLLIPDKDDAVENERLLVMEETNDGFVLAEHDLEQRGPGEFLGTRQAGFTNLRLAKLTDIRLIEKARKLAHNLFERDPELQLSEHNMVLSRLDAFWGDGRGDIS